MTGYINQLLCKNDKNLSVSVNLSSRDRAGVASVDSVSGVQEGDTVTEQFHLSRLGWIL